MALQGRLRVAVEDRADALELVRAEVYAATGLIPEPDFQEIERPQELAGGGPPTRRRRTFSD